MAGEARAMMIRVVAAAVLVMIAMPAQAQMGGRHGMAATRQSRKSRRWTTRPTRRRWSEYLNSKEKI